MRRNRHKSHTQAHRHITTAYHTRHQSSPNFGQRLLLGIQRILHTRSLIRSVSNAGGVRQRVQLISLVFVQKLATICIVTGILILFAPYILHSLFSVPIAEPPPQSQSTIHLSGGLEPAFGPVHIDGSLTQPTITLQPPTRILIPSVNIDVKITEARLVRGYWEVSDVSASHGEGSAFPGTRGNMVIFAHARKGLFLPLRNVKKNDRIYILTNDRWYRYVVDSISTVGAHETHVISQTPDETLTVFTCSGFLDTKRLVVRAKAER